MDIKQDFITINPYSRVGTLLKPVKGIVIHWVANPETTAKNNRDFFETRKSGSKGYGSAHYIIGLEGEIIQCLPLDEMAYHVGAKTYTTESVKKLGNYPNNCTIGIENCHPTWEGNFNEKTYNTLVELTVELCKQFKLGAYNLYRHYDITEKLCPKYFVENNDKWEQFKQDVAQKLV